MTDDKNRQIVLAERPAGELKESHFELREAALPEPRDGEVLVRTLLISIDAANRAWMQGPTYRKAQEEGQVMDGYAVTQVVDSRADGLVAGDIVACVAGWQDYAAIPAKQVVKLDGAYRPLSHYVSLLGIAGKTAYHGLINVGRLGDGETVVVSAAAGSVGTFVGQIAKIKGCRAIGIAGGPEKCGWITQELGFDAAVDYKAGSVREQLAALAPDGIDVYFDNVGGRVLEAALFNMALRGRVVCCGAISQYDTTEMESPRGIPGVIVFKRLRMEGFIVTDFHKQDAEAERDLKAWAADGKLKAVEDFTEGLASAPAALIGILHGDNRGKRIVRVAPDPA